MADAINNTLTCDHCQTAFTAPPVLRGGRVRRFCGVPCRVSAANARRATTRSERAAGALRTPKSGLESPESPSALSTPPEAPNPVDRLAELMAKAHSPTGINAFELADLARLRGLSPWTPARLIMSKDYQPR
jgi:hypothetical protein